MKIGDYVLIEFGKRNNACHVFRADNLPFKEGQKTVSGTTSGLKDTNHSGHRAKLLHQDRWQEKFDDFLSQQAYVKTDAPLRHPQKPVQAIAFSKAGANTLPSNLSALLEQLRAQGIRIEDRRPLGGALWIVGVSERQGTAYRLTSAGFRFKEGKGWWLV
jgi:hypothetical protein